MLRCITTKLRGRSQPPVTQGQHLTFCRRSRASLQTSGAKTSSASISFTTRFSVLLDASRWVWFRPHGLQAVAGDTDLVGGMTSSAAHHAVARRVTSLSWSRVAIQRLLRELYSCDTTQSGVGSMRRQAAVLQYSRVLRVHVYVTSDTYAAELVAHTRVLAGSRSGTHQYQKMMATHILSGSTHTRFGWLVSQHTRVVCHIAIENHVDLARCCFPRISHSSSP
jgi:hypothetical protein